MQSKKIGLFATSIFLLAALSGSIRLFQKGPSYYDERLSLFRQSPENADVVMLGDSITELGNWTELLPSTNVLNRGIKGDTTSGVLKRLDEVIDRHPRTVFLMIGINDLSLNVPVTVASDNIRTIVREITKSNIRIVWQSTLYVTPDYRQSLNARVKWLNQSVRDLCINHEATCLDLNMVLAIDGALSPKNSSDGVHLSERGYLLWSKAISRCVSTWETPC